MIYQCLSSQWCSPHALLYHGYIPQVGGISKMWGPNSACPHLALILRLSPPSTAVPYTKLVAEIDVCVRTTLKVEYQWGTMESPSPCWKWVSMYEKKAKVNLVSYNICWHGFHINISFCQTLQKIGSNFQLQWMLRHLLGCEDLYGNIL
jgi:hypothetical protein